MSVFAYLLKGSWRMDSVYATNKYFKGVESEVYPPYTNAGVPVDGTSGTLVTIAEPGALLIDTTNKTLYQNTNTKASPTWTQLTAVGGTGAYDGTFDGVVGGVTPAAGSFTTLGASGLVTMGSIGNALTAIGTDRAGSLALTKQFNNVTTVGAATAGVTLPASAVGVPVWVWNNGANAMHVYGAGSDTIDGTAGATGVVLTNAKSALYMCVAANTYLSSMGVLSA